MEIRFSDNWARNNAYPEDAVKRCADAAFVHARLKWADDSACRFILVEHRDSPTLAGHEAHNVVIRALLTVDPQAEIRTAKAIFRGYADFINQQKVQS